VKPVPAGSAVDITLSFADVEMYGEVSVYDIFARSSAGKVKGSYTAKQVPLHGTAFLRLTPA